MITLGNGTTLIFSVSFSYTGSANASANAYCDNFESLYVFCDWRDETNRNYVDISESDFDRMWENETEKIRVVPSDNLHNPA